MAPPTEIRPNTSTLLPFNKYDYVIVSFSGGKDSLACVLYALELGSPREKIELFHQAVDGRPGVDPRFFDWPCTESYCRQVAQALGLRIRFQWRENGFLGEIMKGSPRPGLPFALHSSALTAYFKIDPNGKVWATKLYKNATLFSTWEEAQAARLALPQEDARVPRFFSPDELEKHAKRLEKLRQEAETEEDLAEVEEEARRLKEPAVMPPLDFVNITTPVPSSAVGFELTPNGLATGRVGEGSGGGDPGVRLQFPAAVASLQTRWCSAHLKIDVANIAINNDPRFKSAKILEITGERRQESNNRAKYAEIESHKSTTQTRRVDQWRAILDWPEEQVWGIIEKWRIRPHPAYFLNFGRVSCFPCIFSDPNQLVAVKTLAPALFDQILNLERQFGRTIQRGGDIEQRATKGVNTLPNDLPMITAAFSEQLPQGYAVVPPGEPWTLPIGAFKKTGGPL